MSTTAWYGVEKVTVGLSTFPAGAHPVPSPKTRQTRHPSAIQSFRPFCVPLAGVMAKVMAFPQFLYCQIFFQQRRAYFKNRFVSGHGFSRAAEVLCDDVGFSPCPQRVKPVS